MNAHPPPKSRRRPYSLREQFWNFHRDHPQVYATLVRLAREARAVGHRQIGVKMLWEVMRWELEVKTQDPEGFRLNNNYPSRYARLIMQTEPDLAGIFDLRRLRTP